jgi:hypothetical protein
MSLVLDSGALIAYERGSRVVQAILLGAAERRDAIRVPAAVIAQVWREGRKQASLARLLRGVEEVPLSPVRARIIGELLRVAKASDVVDAAVIELANDGDEILTSDPDDLVALAAHGDKTLIITPVR